MQRAVTPGIQGLAGLGIWAAFIALNDAAGVFDVWLIVEILVAVSSGVLLYLCARGFGRLFCSSLPFTIAAITLAAMAAFTLRHTGVLGPAALGISACFAGREASDGVGITRALGVTAFLAAFIVVAGIVLFGLLMIGI